MRSILQKELLLKKLNAANLKKEIQELCVKRPDRKELLDRLQGIFIDIDLHIKLAEIALQQSEPHFWNKVKFLLHLIEHNLYPIIYFYLPGLLKENDEEIFIRKILNEFINTCNLDFIKDIVIRLDSHEATVPHFTDVPVVFASPLQSKSLYLKGPFYHEFGHVVFEKYNIIANQLIPVIEKFFNDKIINLGLLEPSKRYEREKEFIKAKNYWNIDRLNEIFSDIFGTYVAGPLLYLYFAGQITLCDKLDIMDWRDVHPPIYARYYACKKSLNKNYSSDILISDHERIINETLHNNSVSNADFQIICDINLLDRIVQFSIDSIKKLPIEIREYSFPIPNITEIESFTFGTDIITLFICAEKMLYLLPEKYAAWEQQAIQRLRKRYK